MAAGKTTWSKGTTPSNPPAGFCALFFDSSGILSSVDSAGNVAQYFPGQPFTAEDAQDAVGSILTDTSSIDFVYDDTGNTISATVIQSAINTSQLNNDAGFITASEVSDNETLTSLSLPGGNILRYEDEQGVQTNLDLSSYLDDTNLSRIVSGSVDASSGVATFSRDDNSTFTVDFGSLIPYKVFANSITPGLTQSTSYTTYLSMPVTLPTAGNYELRVGYTWSYNNATTNFLGRVQFNGVTIIEHVAEPADAGGTGISVDRIDTTGTVSSGTDQRMGFGNTVILENMSAGAATITLQIANSEANNEATIYRASLVLEKI